MTIMGEFRLGVTGKHHNGIHAQEMSAILCLSKVFRQIGEDDRSIGGDAGFCEQKIVLSLMKAAPA